MNIQGFFYVMPRRLIGR